MTVATVFLYAFVGLVVAGLTVAGAVMSRQAVPIQGNQRRRRYVYHYTDQKGTLGIISVKKIQRSNSSGPWDDAGAGDGVYMTTIRPKEGKGKILSNNYKQILVGKADYFFRFLETDLPGLQRVSDWRDLWKYPMSILLDEVDYAFGETDGKTAYLFNHKTGDKTVIHSQDF